ncbi:MAG: GHKL domain-containing protein [Actinobacteria bacterium]|nr:GHKL domain-containing protein [Actinomycetota bacterium]
MRFYPDSLRQKILIGYIAGAMLVFAFALLSWSNLNTQQEIVSSGETVSSLFDTTLEIRRFEKNYFLYRTAEDYAELRSYIAQAEELLSREELNLFTTPEVIAGLEEDLRIYGDLLGEDVSAPGSAGDPALEALIREKGKEIVTTGEQISASRVEINRESLESAKRNLLIGIGLLLVAVFAGGLIFSRKAVRPLSVLEKHMVRITAGEFSLIPVKFKDREFVSLKAAFNKMLLELRERQDYLVESEKYAALGTLVFGVAHELNNPLANISTSTQILREEIDEGDIEYQKELLEQITEETGRARHIVGSVLNYSRSKERQTFQLRDAVEETVRLIKAEVPASVVLQVDIPEDLTVYADRQKIQQVIINLVKNAIDAIDRVDGKVRIMAVRLDEKNVEIVVIDNGAGMEQEKLAKIFDPFFTSKKEGYGLGLFIVHNIITEYGGSISVDSYPGKGTTFTIVLPMKES